MCRNIKTLFNFDPPVTPEEIRAASLQFVRKISGINTPSRTNDAAFQAAVDDIARIANETGFANRYHFTRVFAKRMGVPPATECPLRSAK